MAVTFSASGGNLVVTMADGRQASYPFDIACFVERETGYFTLQNPEGGILCPLVPEKLHYPNIATVPSNSGTLVDVRAKLKLLNPG